MSNPERLPLDPDDFPSLGSSLEPIPPMTFTPVEDQSLLSTFSRKKQKQLEEMVSQPPATMNLPAIKGYTVLGMLGEGGMGSVFRARKNDSGRIVAVKLIGSKHLGSGGERELRERFIRESAAAARLRHPNIVQIYEIGETDKTPYFAMELCDGGSLKDRMIGQPLPFEDTARVMKSIAEAIDFAHSNQIIHRDLKPANVLMSSVSDGTMIPKVADFGIAKFRDTTEDLTRSGTALGTPAYMSPEQAENARRVTNASDIWSLGVILYELLTGVKPFDGDTPYEIILKVSKASPLRPREVVAAVPKRLEQICLRCLQRVPTDRFASAGDLADALNDYLQTIPDPNQPKRKLPLAMMGMSLAFLMLTIWLFASWQGAESRYAKLKEEAGTLVPDPEGLRPLVSDLKSKLRSTESDLASLRQAEQDAKKQLEDAQDKLSKAETRVKELSSNRGGAEQQVTTLTEQLSKAKEDLKKAESSATSSKGELATLKQASIKLQNDLDTAKSDLTRKDSLLLQANMAKSRAESEVSNLTTSLETTRTELERAQLALKNKPKTENVSVPTRTPTSVAVRLADAFLDQGRFDDSVALLESVPAEERNMEWRLTFRNTRGEAYANLVGHGQVVWSVAASPDGLLLASADLNGKIKIWDGRTGAEKFTLSQPADELYSVAFSPDGTRLLSGGSDGSVRLWNTETGTLVRAYDAHEGKVWCVRFNADGTRFASGGSDSKVKVWTPDTSRVVRTLSTQHGDVTSVCFTPDGKYLLTAGYDERIASWGPDAERPDTLKAHRRGVNSIDVSPDGKWLVSGGEDSLVKIWDFNGWKEKPDLEVMMHDDKVTSVRFSPDGTRVISAGRDHMVKQWNIRDGRSYGVMRGHESAAQSVCYRGSGKGFVSGGADRIVKTWDVIGEHFLMLRAHEKQVNSVVVSRDGVTIASASFDETIRVWDGFSANLRGILRGHKGSVNTLSLAADGITLVSGGDDNSVRLWNLATLSEITTLPGHGVAVIGVAISPDGSRVVSGDIDGVVKVWDTRTEQVIKTIRLDKKAGKPLEARAVAISSDNSRIAYGGEDRLVHVYDLNRQTETHVLREMRERVNGLAFSPHGGLLAGCGNDHSIWIWNLELNREPKKLAGHRGVVRGVVFSEDGSRLFSCSDDRSMRIWDPRSGEELLWMISGEAHLTSVAATLNGNRIVTGWVDNSVIIYDTRPPSTTGATVRDHLFRKAISRFTPSFHLNAMDVFRRTATADPFAEQHHRKWLSFKLNDLSDYSDWDWYELLDWYRGRKETDLFRQAQAEFRSRFSSSKREAALTLSAVFCDPRLGILTARDTIAIDRKRFDVLQREIEKLASK